MKDLAREAEVDVVLRAEHRGGPGEELRLVVPVPHDLEHGVALSGEAVARGHVPAVPVHLLEELGRLPRGARVGPDRNGVAQERAASHPAGSRRGSGPRWRGTPRPPGESGFCSIRVRVLATMAFHQSAGRCSCQPGVRIDGLVGHEGAGQAGAVHGVEGCLGAARAQVVGDDGLAIPLPSQTTTPDPPRRRAGRRRTSRCPPTSSG